MPRPDPISPADLRPGQRVRITMRYADGHPDVVREGYVRHATTYGFSLWEHGYFNVRRLAKIATQTIEVIE